MTVSEIYLSAIISPTTGIRNEATFTLVVEAHDSNGNSWPGYRGGIEFTPKGISTLPDLRPPCCGNYADYVFTAADAGRATFTFAFTQTGVKDIYVYELASPSRNTTSNSVTVTDPPPPTPAPPGMPPQRYQPPPHLVAGGSFPYHFGLPVMAISALPSNSWRGYPSYQVPAQPGAIYLAAGFAHRRPDDFSWATYYTVNYLAWENPLTDQRDSGGGTGPGPTTDRYAFQVNAIGSNWPVSQGPSSMGLTLAAVAPPNTAGVHLNIHAGGNALSSPFVVAANTGFDMLPACGGDSIAVGDPIDTRSGEFYLIEPDLGIVTGCQGIDLRFTRVYRSQSLLVDTPFGYGWTHNYNQAVVTLNSEYVAVRRPFGEHLIFKDVGADVYASIPGLPFILVKLPGGGWALVNQQRYVDLFDATGKLIAQQDPNGNMVWLTYETVTRGSQTVTRLARVDALGGRFLWFGYDYYDMDQLIQVADHTGRKVEYAYDQFGFLATVTDTLGGTTTYSYQNFLMTDKVDPLGQTVFSNQYDNGGRVLAQTNNQGQSLYLNYLVTTAGITTTVTEEGTGAQTVYVYDNDGRLRQVVDDFGAVTSLANYDVNRRPASFTDARAFTTDLTFNSLGLPTVITDALSNVTTFSYDAYLNISQTVNARNATTVYRYDHPIYPRFATSMIDALGNTTYYTPTIAGLDNPFGGLLREERDANGRLSTYSYSDAGQLIVKVVAPGTPDAFTTRYGYDILGRLITETTTTENHLRRYFYDDGDRLVAQIENWDSFLDWRDCSFAPGPRDHNVCTLYGYDAIGRVISTTNALGQTTLTFYDPDNRTDLTVSNYDGAPFDPADPAAGLCSFQVPVTSLLHEPRGSNLCSLSHYDGYGRVITSTDSLGRQTVTTYDNLGRISRSVTNWYDGIFAPAQPDRDIETRYAYDEMGNTILITDTLGRVTRQFYDPLGRTAGTIANWDGSTTLDDCGNLPPERDDNICTRYSYDAVGNTILTTDTLGRHTRTFYDPLDRVTAVVHNWNPTTLSTPANCVLSPDNMQTENVCTLFGYDSLGRQITSTNALNQTTLTLYDAAGRAVVQVANWDGQAFIQPNGAGCATDPLATANICHLTTYDAFGRRAATNDPLGNVTQFTYDGLGRIVTTTRTLAGLPVTSHNLFDAAGNRLAATDANGHTTTYVYDSLNRLALTTSPEGVTNAQFYNAAGWVIATTNGLGQAVTTTYDELGRRLTTTDAEGHTTTYTYDALGNQVMMIDAEGVRTAYVYDKLNRLVQVIENHLPGSQPGPDTNITTAYRYDALGNQLQIINALGISTTTTLYDAANRPIIVRDALGRETRTQYNALGHRVVITDANTAVTHFTYDGLNRLARIDYLADGESVAYGYDATGNRVVMTDSLGLTSYEYDDLYRLLRVTGPFTGTVAYRYDLAGNRLGLTYPDGRVITNTYNLDNRLVQVADWQAGVTTYAYDGAGRLITTTLPNGVQTINVYDRADRLVQLIHLQQNGHETQANFAYTLDGLGNRLVATETLRLPDNHLQTTVVTYQYDPLYRLTGADYTGGLTATYRYVYDAVGNMPAYTETVGTDTASVVRTFNTANQLVTSSDTEIGTTSFYYDASGNLVQILPPGVGGETWAGALRYGFNQRNLLITSTLFITNSGWVNQVQYFYDGDGNRHKQADFTGEEAVVTVYINDNAGLSTVLVASNGITTTHNLVGLDLISQDNGAQTRFLLADGLGSVRQEMVGSTLQTTATYEPYGKLLAQSGASGTVYGFAGEQFDASSGLIYLRARTYHPSLKLFISRDPFSGWDTLPASQHGYSYAHNNPVNLTDPTGESVTTVITAVGRCFGNPACLTLSVVAGLVYYAWNISHNAVDLSQSFLHLWNLCAAQLAPPRTQTRNEAQTKTQTASQQETGQKPTSPGTNVLPPGLATPTPQPFKKVLIVGDGNFSYSESLHSLHLHWEITGTSYDGGYNSQTFIRSSGNLKLYADVDATRLHEGWMTKYQQFDAVVFNAPRATAPLRFKSVHGDLVDAILSSALSVLAPGGQMRFSSSGGMPAANRLQQRVRANEWPPGYSNAYQGSLYYADPDGFGVPYQPSTNENETLKVRWDDMYWYVFVK